MAHLFVAALPALAQEAPPGPITPKACLVARRTDQSRRTAIHTDAIEAQVVCGTWKAPKGGEEVGDARGRTSKWEEVAAGEDGAFAHAALQNGYAYFSVEALRDGVWTLDAGGHSMVYVNSVPRAGDPYDNGIVKLPVRLKAGRNDLLFACGRGRLHVRLDPVDSAPVILIENDCTLPDLIVGEPVDTVLAVVVVNRAGTMLNGASLAGIGIDRAASDAPWNGDPAAVMVSTLPEASGGVPADSVRKIGIRLRAPRPERTGPTRLALVLKGTSSPVRISLRLNVVKPEAMHKRTFVSAIDGSVQYFAVQPARVPEGSAVAARPALFLTLHGASVEATNQAAAYSPKLWGHLVAPTNRRPFGFDWEDWGRLDAMEVLDIAQRELKTDPHRVYLTGHSMGGHGTWSVGATFPDRFAALGPSAGWISFWSYAGATRAEGKSQVADILQRATASSDTLAMVRNYLQQGIYILHGDKDDNVPIEQAREMYKRLREFHHDVESFEQPGAGHWWGGPGEGCVDWPAMFDLFARHRLPGDAEVRHVEFVTVNPGVSSRCRWATIEAQHKAMMPSRVDLTCDPAARRIRGTTTNVSRLSIALDAAFPGGVVEFELDGQKMRPAGSQPATRGGDAKGPGQVLLVQKNGSWSLTGPADPRVKGPRRSGPFKNAFNHRFMLVYGTRGSDEENAWAMAKARFDAEMFWYRGNGSVDVIPDAMFRRDAAPDRSVILYGHSDSNGAWKALLDSSPVQLGRGRVRVGERAVSGDDLACLFLQPRPGSDVALVGVVGGTGVRGMRLTDRLPYFQSGVAYPDCIVLGADALTAGIAGVRAAGYFGDDWGVASGEFAWGGEAASDLP